MEPKKSNKVWENRAPPNFESNVITFSSQPMFKSFIPSIIQQLKLCNIMATIPFGWDKINGRMCVLKSKLGLKVCQVQMGLQIGYTLLMTGYFFIPANQLSISTSDRMVALAFLVCFWTTMLTRVTFWNHKEDVVLLMNNYVEFEGRFLTEQTPSGSKGDKLSQALMTLGFLTSTGLPGLMCTILLVTPCKPPHLGFILFWDGVQEQCIAPVWPIRLCILTFDTWMWANCIPPACFFAFQVYYLGIKCLAFYLKLALGGGAKVVASIRFYNQLRLLAKLYNFCLQSVFIPTQMTAACAVIIIGLYTCVKLHSEIPMPGLAFFPLLASDGLSMIFISQSAADVYTRSDIFVKETRKWRLNYAGKGNAWLKKVVKATTIIKIRFGSTNYIDQMTPLVYLNFCLTQTVSLVLLS